MGHGNGVIVNLKLRDLANCKFSNWLWRNKIKKISYDVISV